MTETMTMDKESLEVSTSSPTKKSKKAKEQTRPDRFTSAGVRIPYWDEQPEKRMYKFIYNEQPDTSCSFTMGVLYVDKFGQIKNRDEKYTYSDGEVYEMPVYVAKHLNSKTVPDPKYKEMPDGTIKHVKNAVRPRFTCIEVD